VLAVVQEFGDSMALAFCAGAAMALSGLTDAWDGALARRWNVVSPLGKMADPLMD
jgi:phosphatidylglycerophosphate synthase